jgi:hypothetical protein
MVPSFGKVIRIEGLEALDTLQQHLTTGNNLAMWTAEYAAPKFQTSSTIKENS